VTTDAGLGIQHREEQASLFRAVQQLETVLAARRDDDRWYASARAALRGCTLAVEHALDSLTGPDGLALSVVEDEPRLIPELERLEASLAKLLVELWETKGHPQADGFAARLDDLARGMRHAASETFELVYEALNSPGQQD
jgi:hypothetical protein